MKIVRFVDEGGRFRWGEERTELSAAVIDGDPLMGAWNVGGTTRIVRRLAPVIPPNVFCIGRNYRAHAREMGSGDPAEPLMFMKPTTAVTGPGARIVIPAACDRGPELDYEGELAVVIGRVARDVPVEDALSYVGGYTCANDVSARIWQKERGGGQWIRGKGFDSFCPLGPVLVPAADIPDPQQLRVTTSVNGELVQDGSTADMIFSVAALISFLSQDTTLLPGTVILTGTPPGVGAARTPPRFLAHGDLVTVEIEGIGTLKNTVVSAESLSPESLSPESLQS